MRNTILATALAFAGLAALPAASHAAENGGFFINGGIGQSSVDKGPLDDDDTGYNANVGYRWAVAPNVLLGVEGGYTDLGSFDSSPIYQTVIAPNGGSQTFVGRARADVKGWNLGVNGHFNLTPNWYISGRGGYFRPDLEVRAELPVGNQVTRFDDTENTWYAGAGFGYDFNNNVSVGLNYDYFRADKDHFSGNPSLVTVSGEYRF